ncbi:MAG: type II toxin-antitoxin system HicB family antitoxin [Chromatiales bacterium]
MAHGVRCGLPIDSTLKCHPVIRIIRGVFRDPPPPRHRRPRWQALGRVRQPYTPARVRGILQEDPVTEYNYTVIIEREESGGYHAFCPTLRGCHSQGDSYEETVQNITEAVQLYIES